MTDDPTFDATDGAHPAWWRGHDYVSARFKEELDNARKERDEALTRIARAEIDGARKALDAVVEMLESCDDRRVPIGWYKSAWETFCLHRYGAADDVRAMKPEDILK